MTKKDYDAVIIGAGMSGLAAGIRLAHFDKRVLLLDAHTRLGGLNSYYEINGRKYDVGLHAVTNYVPKGTRGAPLSKLLKQLRLSYDDFGLVPQRSSAVLFPDNVLSFSNGTESLSASVRKSFPHEAANFQKLCEAVSAYDETALDAPDESARQFVGQFIKDDLLIEMLFCPLMYYGSATEKDMPLWQFCIMFQSVFMEGFARPREGVRHIIKLLRLKYKENGGELKLGKKVVRLSEEKGNVRGVELENGECYHAPLVFSSAGLYETYRLLPERLIQGRSELSPRREGKLSFIEVVFTLDCQPQDLGEERTILFVNGSRHFQYRKPKQLVDYNSGVICFPNNFQYDTPLEEGWIRGTFLANYDRWKELSQPDYQKAKEACILQAEERISSFVSGFSSHIVARDMFTPCTVERFTGHINGAVYGAEKKSKEGKTPLNGLYLIGTDQGFLGITGALLSGISIANRYGLR